MLCIVALVYIAGALLGHILMDSALGVKFIHRRAAVRKFVAQTAMFGGPAPGRVDTMLMAMVGSRFRPRKVVAIPDPAALSEKDAKAIGNSMKVIWLGHHVPAEAAHEIVQAYAPLFGRVCART